MHLAEEEEEKCKNRNKIKMLEDKGHRKNTPTCIFHGRNYFTNSVVI